MKQILVLLQNNNGTAEWYYSEQAAAEILGLKQEYMGRQFPRDPQGTVRDSFNRTLRIMVKQGLITTDARGRSSLTGKGKKLALKVDKEVRQYLRDFSFLLKRSSRKKGKIRGN